MNAATDHPFAGRGGRRLHDEAPDKKLAKINPRPMSYRPQFSLKGLMIAVALVAIVLSGLFAKFVSLGSAPLVLLMALIALDLLDGRRRRR